MTKDQLFRELDDVNATRACRAKYAAIIVSNPNLIKPLLEVVFLGNRKKSPRASWILEHVYKDNPKLLFPYIDYFFENLKTLHIDSATRPCVKIVELLIESYYKKKDAVIIQLISMHHKEQIIEACFDWLIREEKVAVKVYSMNALFYLGMEFDWIHSELKTIIERDYHTHSAGFKAKSRHILKRMSKLI